MLEALVVRSVRWSSRHPWSVLLITVALTAWAVWYCIGHFAINTDVARLIDSHEAWAVRDSALDAAFPERNDVTLLVVDAPAQELADAAAGTLAADLARDPRHFHSIVPGPTSPFFRQNGLLYLAPDDVAHLSDQLLAARPLLGQMAQDPSLRGLSNLLGATLGVPLHSGQIQLSDMQTLLGASAATVEKILAGQPAALSWRGLFDGSGGVAPGRSLVETHPVLDYGAVAAGAAAADAARARFTALGLPGQYLARLRLTGPVPLADEEFASVEDGALPNTVGTLAVVLVILWLALRSFRSVAAVFFILITGLAITAALGLLMVGALNMISVAFAVLFIGIGVDFSIQFGVRLREKRPGEPTLEAALIATAHSIALPLGLAALATGASFFTFLPTAYRGVAELGLIAGVGILFVAFPMSITVLPALTAVLRPTLSGPLPGWPQLAPLDRFFERYRLPVLAATVIVIGIGALFLPRLQFDFNPLHLKNAHTESMATLTDLADSPDAGVNDVQVLAADSADAERRAARLRPLPEVARVTTLESFVPDDVATKRDAIAKAAAVLLPVLAVPAAASAPDLARVNALRNAARQLHDAALDFPGAGAPEAERLARDLRALAAAPAGTRDAAEKAFGLTLRLALEALSELLQPADVRRDTLPPALAEEWQNARGQDLIDVAPRVPKGADPNDDALLRRFCDAVLRAEPDAIGGPISVIATAHTIQVAFEEAAGLAVLAIALLLWATLKRWADVLRTLVPLLVSAAVTLELCVAFGIALNFANIIALPLLLGIGVAFKIYYVLAWREGRTGFLQSGLTQAVILSAATTATAFGSLWLSQHPGTSSMGKLLALSLACTLIGAVLFQPVLMGRPRARDQS